MIVDLNGDLNVQLTPFSTDYLHMTRRFGIVAASQLPLHYLLAAKSWSPIQYLTRMSHEQLNPYHRLLGRIIIAFFSAHAALYANFYIQSNLLHRFGSQTVILGLTAISILHMLGISSLAKIREYSYLLFFVLHVVLSIVLLPVLWFHVRHIRVYIVESALMYLLIIIQRKVSQTPTLATLSLLPSTPDAHALLTVSIPLPINKFRVYRPGQHIYLSLPPTDPSKPWEKLRFNPFTIASTSSEPNSTSTVSTTATTQPTSGNAKTPSLTLLIRPLRSSTARLASLARTSNAQPVPVILEGPYGSSTYFPDLASESFSRILLVAGGVGATFTLPIYRDLMARRRGRGVSMVWAVRREEEAKALLKAKGEGVEIYVTGKGRGKEEERSRVDHSHTEADDNAVELEERAGLLGHVEGSAQEDVVNQAEGASSDVKYGRPNPSIIADEVFESEDEGGKVAVLLCGPAGIGRELRREVGRFVKRGREVFWHEEEFSW